MLDAFAATRLETGAVVSFTGLMRAEQGDADVLELDAYPGFTEAEIGKAGGGGSQRGSTCRTCWSFTATAPSNPATRSCSWRPPRRTVAKAFEAVDHLMDYLKSRAPFWKRSTGPHGARWIEPTAQDIEDAARWDVAPAAEDAG